MLQDSVPFSVPSVDDPPPVHPLLKLDNIDALVIAGDFVEAFNDDNAQTRVP